MLSRFFFRADFQKFDLVKLRIYNYYYLIIFLADLNYKSASFYGITSNFWLLQIRRKSVARRCIVLITHFFPYWPLMIPKVIVFRTAKSIDISKIPQCFIELYYRSPAADLITLRRCLTLTSPLYGAI